MSGMPVPEYFFSPVFWVVMIAGITAAVIATGFFLVKVARAVWRGWR